MTTPTKACPSCAGAWLYNLTFDHGIDCPLRMADDATVAADYDRCGWYGTAFTRLATTTEQTLAAALGRPANPSPDAASCTRVIPRSASTRRRLLSYGPDGQQFDPDPPDTDTDPEAA